MWIKELSGQSKFTAMFAIVFVVLNIIVYAIASEVVSYFWRLKNSKFEFRVDIDILKTRKEKEKKNVNMTYF